MAGAGGPMRVRATAKIREIEIFGYKTFNNIEDDPTNEDESIDKISSDHLDALLN